jgi:hypothetical protein
MAAEPSPAPSPVAPSPSSAESKRAVTRTTPTDTTLDIVDADLCRSLSRAGAWRCSPVSDPVDAGRLYFYTRLKVPRVTTVNHRWYRGNRLVQAVELRIQPNASAGYRTFSQNTVTVGSGDWRVELTSGDGAVLHQVRFVVR